jgi:hypothetical protein
MTGGIRRQASAIRALAGPKTIFLENGVLTGGPGKQEDLKADALSEALAGMGADAIHLTAGDAQAGEGRLRSMLIAGRGKFISSVLEEGEGTLRFLSRGPFLIGATSANPSPLASVLGRSPVEPSEAVAQLVARAQAQSKASVLLIDGGLVEAEALAKLHPSLALICYRRTGEPTSSKAGKVWLVSPGDHGKYLAKLEYSGSFQSMTSIALTPDYADDKATDRIYRSYLKLVDAEDLLAKVKKSPSEPFAGTAECIRCHSSAGEVWRASEHAHALTTLEVDGHGRDPECVPCHVVGLTSKGGFSSSASTPELSHVGCESCHGPGKAHSAAPASVKMPLVGASSCAPCHKSDHSPGFDFATYWTKIQH